MNKLLLKITGAVALAGVGGMFAVVAIVAMIGIPDAKAQQPYGHDYGYQDEVQRSGLQYCYPEYDTWIGRDRIRRYTGDCYATFNAWGDPLYLYREYRYCEVERRSKGILSYTRIDCGSRRFDRVRHPDYRPPRRHYDPRFDPPPHGWDRDWDRDWRRDYDRDLGHPPDRRNRDQRRDRRGDDLRERRNDLLRERRERNDRPN